MQLSTEALEQFKKMYMDMYKIQLTNQQAIEYGIQLIGFVKAVYGANLPKSKTLDTGIKRGDN